MVNFDSMEEWSLSRGLLDFSDSRNCVPLAWGEDDPIPLYVEAGSRAVPEPDGSLRLSYAYHEKLKRISGTLGASHPYPSSGRTVSGLASALSL
jgi:hypothetical protein